jgi:uncharacterized DUF497 family protein
MNKPSFEWDETKHLENIFRHGVSFYEAQQAFRDKKRIILADVRHSEDEQRFFCLGKVHGEIMTVRFTYRNGKIRIFGAAYWRKGKKRYEEENNIHR